MVQDFSPVDDYARMPYDSDTPEKWRRETTAASPCRRLTKPQSTLKPCRPRLPIPPPVPRSLKPQPSRGAAGGSDIPSPSETGACASRPRPRPLLASSPLQGPLTLLIALASPTTPLHHTRPPLRFPYPRPPRRRNGGLSVAAAVLASVTAVSLAWNLVREMQLDTAQWEQYSLAIAAERSARAGLMREARVLEDMVAALLPPEVPPGAKTGGAKTGGWEKQAPVCSVEVRNL